MTLFRRILLEILKIVFIEAIEIYRAKQKKTKI